MRPTTLSVIFTALVFFCITAVSFAVPPTEEVIQKLKDEGRFDRYIENMKDARARGVNTVPLPPGKDAQGLALSPDQTFRAIVLLIDFPDKPYTGGWAAGTVADFDSLLFSDGINPTGSMKEYFFENSYGDFTLLGDVYGWYTSANNASYYTNFCDGSHGMGSYPHNSQKLVEEAIDAADPYVDFSLYDNDGDGWVDGLFVVHAGTGYEESDNDCEIHSHAWGINPRLRDGVYLSGFSIEPEEEQMEGLIPIGVFCHEFGHQLGLPDLYDTDYTSRGAGYWALMASGSWNGDSRTPSQLIAWSKYQLGWMSLTNITSNQTDVSVPAIEWTPTAYRLWRNGLGGNEYFIVENRQWMGFDAALPGEGLLIWHIDDNVYGNTNDWHPQVFLEQADGKFDLQYKRNRGDGSDPFPNGGAAPYFHDQTTPDSRDYYNMATQVAVWDIPAPDSIMIVDLDVVWSRPYLEMVSIDFDDGTYGDGDGFLEEGETIEVIITISNIWKDAVGATATLTVDDASLFMSDGTTSLGTIATSSSADNTGDPFTFDVPVSYTPRIDSFYIEISSNGGADVTVLAVEQNIGVPRVMLVDDDGGDDIDLYYSEPFSTKRSPYGLWDKFTSGSPLASDLTDFEAVFWFTGDYRLNPLTAADLSALTTYLDGGGKLFMSGQGIAKQLSTADPTFMADYLKANYVQTVLVPLLIPEAGGQVLAGLDTVVIAGAGGAGNQTAPDWITAAPGGVAELYYYASTDLGAVSYDGSYQSVFFSFGFEAIPRDDGRWEERDSVFNRVMEFLGLKEISEFPELSDLAVGPGVPMNMTEHSPDISWTYYDEGDRPQEQYRLQVGTDADWTTAEMWDPGAVSGSETNVAYGGAALLDGQTYYFRAQAYNGVQWSNWQNDQFRMNSHPSAPSGHTPTNMSAVTSATPDLEHLNATDGEGDVLTYSYEVYDDEALTSLVTSDDGHPEGIGSTSWTVNFALADEGQYYWRVRAHDAYEYGDWSDSAAFWVNSVNQPPAAFSLIDPPDEAVMFDLLPTFTWASTNAGGDLIDDVVYLFIYSMASDFTVADSADGLSDTTHTLIDSISLGSSYYWKVEAHDNFGGVRVSTETFSISTWVPGDANGDGDLNVGDAVYLINYVFKSGPAPEPMAAGDPNGDCAVNVGDAVYMINFVFKGGDPPIYNSACVYDPK